LKVKVKVGLKFLITFITQHLGLSMTQIWVKTTHHCLECTDAYCIHLKKKKNVLCFSELTS